MDVLSHTLSSDQIQDLKSEFEKIDLSNTGYITVVELRTVLKTQGISDADIQHIFDGIDLNHSGRIHYRDFIAATISRKNITEENLLVAFERMANHKKVILREDLCDLLGNTTDDIDEILAEINLSPTKGIVSLTTYVFVEARL